jgi:hypothetical protein
MWIHRGALVLLLAALAVAGCTTTPAASPSADPTPGDQGQPAPGMLAEPWLPPWAGPETPVEIAGRQGVPFCGVEDATIDVRIRSCFAEAVRRGDHVEFARLATTTEGDPIATVFVFEPPESFVLLIDSSQDQWGHPGWQVFTCEAIEDAAEVVRFDGCAQAPPLP